MATARKTPVKRPASGSAASSATKRARNAVSKTTTQKIDGATTTTGRKIAQKRVAASSHATVKRGAGTRGNAEAGAAPLKANGRAVASDGAAAGSSHSLVADSSQPGEVVRKSRVVTADGKVPVQIGGLVPEIKRPDYWDRACADLMKRDRILKKLIPTFGEIHLVNLGDPFSTLARSVAGQQISTKAAQAIWERVKGACPEVHPSHFIKFGHEKLQACGLSKRKAEYILDLAQHFESGALHVESWVSMDDEAVIAELTQIRGIGRWTAEMFLIFNLSRPNVLPLDDLGLIQAISVNYFSGEPVTRSEAREVAANWEPWRTVATWYMWRSLNPIPADH
ncbi:DNA-3-methyladenine glycosylase II [Candidatus Burkholderia verschuerenii]|uniref:DNA-3-methyladenine glycosylase II n=1 Tax=Candidatus Burkholderia verschuerenii TaxID=242163 RepID=A0A0L0MIA5_9BURK|nr:DNA-3-methyladenine glycosylase [Candidatus Burkholderia verschuerenii]KND62048.1 DNA-3-methyladenine glycosylase II [Candidatus Burkholderia verschuerenii]